MTSCIKLITQVASKTVQTCFLVVPLWSPTEIIQKSNTRMSFFNGPWSRLKDNMKVRDETNNRLSLERWILFKKKHANEKQEKRKFLNNAFTPRWRESVVCLILSNSLYGVVVQERRSFTRLNIHITNPRKILKVMLSVLPLGFRSRYTPFLPTQGLDAATWSAAPSTGTRLFSPKLGQGRKLKESDSKTQFTVQILQAKLCVF